MNTELKQSREQQIIEYIEKKGEARAVDILAHLNTINQYSVGITGLKITLSELYRKGALRKDKWGLYSPAEVKLSPFAYVGTVNRIMVNYEELANITASVFNMTIGDLQSKNRQRPIADARKAFFYFAVQLRDKQKLNDGLKKIGKMLNKDHATVIHACKAAEELIQFDEEFKNKIQRIDSAINKQNFKMANVYADDRTIGFYYNRPNELKRYDQEL